MFRNGRSQADSPMLPSTMPPDYAHMPCWEATSHVAMLGGSLKGVASTTSLPGFRRYIIVSYTYML